MEKEYYKQISSFDDTVAAPARITDGKIYSTNDILLPLEIIGRLDKYDLDLYIEDVTNLGLETTWSYICQYVINNKGNVLTFLDIDNFGELYEIGLAIQDKLLKKKNGQYYTPDDVAYVMSEWLEKSEGTAVCDVACGTGKLILTYLDLIGKERARELISSGKLYLYDSDNVALKICRTAIAIKYGLDIADCINDIYCDFLGEDINLPKDCKVISNPPYARIEKFEAYWKQTEVLIDTKELYSAFMEKIFSFAKSAVVITPFSFISGAKFYSLRKQMCEIGSGFIVAFDNVPGNVFCGRKHGIFNTNTSNSVRAAITVIEKSDRKGFRLSPLIRFKNEQRGMLFVPETLKSLLSEEIQVVDNNTKMFKKIENGLLPIYKDWINKSTANLKDYISKSATSLFIDMPNTCRYFTTASARKLSRNGSNKMYFSDEEAYDFIYCFINSSFPYWWWRIFDGGITYSVSLLNSIPIPINLLTYEDKLFFRKMRKKMTNEEDKFIVTKLNAGVVQENIKFPEAYRLEINERILKILGHSVKKSIFDKVHSNSFCLEPKTASLSHLEEK